MTEPRDIIRIPVDQLDGDALDWPRASHIDDLVDERDANEVVPQTWPIPLMGKSVTGPFFEQASTGAPLVELCIVTRATQGGRTVERAETIDLITHDTRWSDLRADADLEDGRYRRRVRSANGQILAAHDLTPGQSAIRGRQGKERTRPTVAQAAAQSAEQGRVEAERAQLAGEVQRLHAELADTRRKLDDATLGRSGQVREVRARLMAEMDDARELARKRHHDDLERQAERFARQLDDLRTDLRAARDAQRRAEDEDRKAERAQWEAEKKALLASAGANGGASARV